MKTKPNSWLLQHKELTPVGSLVGLSARNLTTKFFGWFPSNKDF